MATKTVILRAFRFSKELTLTSPSDDILSQTKKCLESTIAEEREMQLNQGDETRESDLLSGYEIQKGNIFAIMMRIAPGADDTHIDDTLMKKNSFSIGEMKRFSTADRAIYKSHYYICFNNDFLVTSLPRTTNIARFETYLNWLLNSHYYTLVPVVIPTPDITLADIDSITVKPQTSRKRGSNDEQSIIKSRWLDITEEFLHKIPELLFGDSQSLSDIEWQNVIAAEIILKIKNKSKFKDDEFQKVFGSLLKPVSETDQIVLKNKRGESIKGSEILKIKPVDIEITENKFLVEPALHQEMARFIDELETTKSS